MALNSPSFSSTFAWTKPYRENYNKSRIPENSSDFHTVAALFHGFEFYDATEVIHLDLKWLKYRKARCLLTLCAKTMVGGSHSQLHNCHYNGINRTKKILYENCFSTPVDCSEWQYFKHIPWIVFFAILVGYSTTDFPIYSL